MLLRYLILHIFSYDLVVSVLTISDDHTISDYLTISDDKVQQKFIELVFGTLIG